MLGRCSADAPEIPVMAAAGMWNNHVRIGCNSLPWKLIARGERERVNHLGNRCRCRFDTLSRCLAASCLEISLGFFDRAQGPCARDARRCSEMLGDALVRPEDPIPVPWIAPAAPRRCNGASSFSAFRFQIRSLVHFSSSSEVIGVVWDLFCGIYALRLPKERNST